MTTLSELLQTLMQRARVGTQTLSNLTGISRSSLNNWWDGTVSRPRHWRPLLQIAQALALTPAEVEALLAAAGYPALAELAQALPADDPDRRYLQLWLEPLSAAALVAVTQRLEALETRRDAPPVTPLRHQLHTPAADFVGRTGAISALLNALRDAQDGAVAAISGVRGMGGIGKTELSYWVANQLSDIYSDAQIVINLRGVSATPLPVEQALQQVIHAFTPDAQLSNDVEALQQRYCAVLHGQRALILADDARDAAQVRPLLPPPGCALLVTSRQRFTLPGMTTIDLEHLSGSEAITLLGAICDRLSADEARAIAQACGYLPLALRISGSILHNDPALSVAAYCAQLKDTRQRLLQLRDPDDPALDVAASLALSYAQLDAATQRVFRQLGVFVANFDTPMALAIVEAPGLDVEAMLRLLLRRNLLMYDAPRGRWQLHDLLRDLARSYLEVAGEWQATMWRYAQAAMQIAVATQEQYRAGGDVLGALARFDAERPHIDSAWHWASAHAGTPEGDQLLLDTAAATIYIGDLRYDIGHERIPQSERALEAARRLSDRRSEGQILNYLGVAYANLGDAQHAILCFERRLTIAQELGDRRGEGLALGNLGIVYQSRGDAQHAIPYFEQHLAIAQEIGDRRSEGIALGNMGGAYTDLGDVRRAIPCFERRLAIAQEIGDRRGEGFTLGNMGLAYSLGDAQRAIECCELALSIAREVRDQRLEGYVLSYLARVYMHQDSPSRATAAFDQALALLHAVGDRAGESECSWHFGLFLMHQGEWKRAMRLLRAAVAYEDEIGHIQAAEHAALLVQLEAGGALPASLLHPVGQRAVGGQAGAGETSA